MRARRVVIELLPTRVDVVVHDGRSRQSHGGQAQGVRLPVQMSSTAAAWLKDIRALAANLRGAVEQLGAAGLPATVLYRSPTQAVDLADLHLSSPGEACEAAKLSIFESLPYTEVSAVCQAVCVGRDSGGEKRRTHVVVTAERDDVAGAIVQMVEEAGLKFAGSVPVDAAITAMLVRQCLDNADGRRGLLYIGEYSSMFLLADNGRLVFSRRIGLGVELLATTLTRRAGEMSQEPGDSGSPMLDAQYPTSAATPETGHLTPALARSIILRYGIPEREAVLHRASGLTGAHVIPVIQPLLQRFLLELRQSLRFGLGDEQRRGLCITCLGPGSAVPNLAKLVGDELGATITGVASQETSDRESGTPEAPDAPGCSGSELHDAMADRGTLDRLNLQPVERAKAQQVSRLKRWLVSGAAAALLVVAFDAVRINVNLTSARQQATALASRTASDDALRLTQNRLQAAIGAMRLVDHAIESQIGRRADTHAILHELTVLTPESIRFTSISFSAQQPSSRSRTGAAGSDADGTPHLSGRLVGFAGRSSSQGTALQAFIQRLRESPLFDTVVLGDVHAGSMNGTDGERFEISLMCIAVPSEGSIQAGPSAGTIAGAHERSGHE